MIMEITKRDGRKTPYSRDKIAMAIFKAAKAVGGDNIQTAQELSLKVESYLLGNNSVSPTVEQVQDAVEKMLIENGHTRTAKEFILYRSERSKVREMSTRLMKVFEDLTFKDASENDIKRENANIDGDTAMGTMLKYGSESAKRFYDMFILNPAHSSAHNSGSIHIHDLDFLTLTTTCCQIDLTKLFKGNFSTGHGFLREPNDIRSYSALACIAIQSNQNDQHGGQSVPFFDYDMAPGVAKTFKKLYKANLIKLLDIFLADSAKETANTIITELAEAGNVPTLANVNDFTKLVKSALLAKVDVPNIDAILEKVSSHALKETEDATYQAMEAFIHNLNTMHSRAGAQIPFSSINYGTDTSPEGRMVVKNLLLTTKAGLGGGETPIFPIQIFKIKEGVNYNPGEPNYDLFKLSCEVSAKRLFPNFSFIDAPFNLQYYKEGRPETEVAYMGCRTRVIGNVYDPSREIVTGRGNLSFTSINLPRLAIESKGDVDLFFTKLDSTVNLVIEQLLERFAIQCKKKMKNFPFLMGQGVWLDSDKYDTEDSIDEVIKHGTLSCGFIGLAECLTSLIGVHHGQSKEAQELGLKIVGFIRKRLDEKAAETKLNFSLIATPAEGLSGRFINIDKNKYGVIKGITDREYYTNSFHVPVWHEISAMEKIALEAPYHALTNAGHITYVELEGDPAKNVDAFEAIVRMMKESGVGYGSVNHPVDRDSVCGYTGIIDNVCPGCKRDTLDPNSPPIERIRRITGYLVGTLDRFNNAKRSEVNDRVKHGISAGMEQI